MDSRIKRIISLFFIFFSILLLFPSQSYCSNIDREISFKIEIGERIINSILYISIPESFYDYYKKLDHNFYEMKYFSRFVTPELFESMALNIRKITDKFSNSDEVFANIVLEIIQQIPYKKSNVKFPIETLVQNFGDCDSLTVLAASIMKAGGLDVVLFFYEDNLVNHMNLGIHLANGTINKIEGVELFSYEWEEKDFFVAETTGEGWKIGRQPKNYTHSEPIIIPIEKKDNYYFEVIPSKLNSPLLLSNNTINLKPNLQKKEDFGTKISLSGSISPALPDQKIIVKIKHESKADTEFEIIKTDKLGNYFLTYDFNSPGRYFVQSTWVGNENYSASDSKSLIVNVGLSHVLEEYELNKFVKVYSRFIEIPSLDKIGERILGGQRVKTILEQKFNRSTFSMNGAFLIFGNDDPYLTEHNITIPGFEDDYIIQNYRYRMHSYLDFTFSQDQINNKVKIQILDNADMQEVLEDSTNIFIDSSDFIKENRVHYIKTKFLDGTFDFQLINEEGSIFNQNIDLNFHNKSEIKIIMKYDPNSIIFLNNFEQINFQVDKNYPNDFIKPFNIPDNPNKFTKDQEIPITPESILQFEEQKKDNNILGIVHSFFLTSVILWVIILVILRKYKDKKIF
jgi:hypothetical protein